MLYEFDLVAFRPICNSEISAGSTAAVALSTMSVRDAGLARGAKVWSYRRPRIRPARRSRRHACSQQQSVKQNAIVACGETRIAAGGRLSRTPKRARWARKNPRTRFAAG